ncbi:hypothetical protein CR513_04508, partial [Mucuna pruriens]
MLMLLLLKAYQNRAFGISDWDHIYDVCQFARQTRLHYQLSRNRASGVFELIHFDICGQFPLYLHMDIAIFNYIG